MDKSRETREFSFDTLRAYRTGEKKTFLEKENSKDWKFKIEPEFIPRATP